MSDHVDCAAFATGAGRRTGADVARRFVANDAHL